MPAKHATKRGEIILLRETVLKEEGGRIGETSFFFHQLRKLMETNNNNKELYLHDHTSIYRITKAVFRNQN